DVAELLGQFQQPYLHADDLLLLGHVVVSVHAGGRAAVPALGENRVPPPRLLSGKTNNECQVKSKLIHITIEHIAKNHIRKEDVVARVLVVRGDRPGLVHIISAMEACDTYKPWHDKHTHRTFLRPDTGKCLHYYFYFIDAELGLIYLRVPTWCPFRLQF